MRLRGAPVVPRDAPKQPWTAAVVFEHGHRVLMMVDKSHLIWGVKSHGGVRTSAIHRARLLKLKKQIRNLGFPIGGKVPAWRKRTTVTFCSVRNPPRGWLWGGCGTRCPRGAQPHVVGAITISARSACWHFTIPYELALVQ